ncbi:MAG: hypothetical protein CMF39_01435 [Legionellaceae bacterium]|mgnify:CR=1 FL=1|nr:hypothetical protein [Legionellaceae bacterium]|tara:strand:- start:1725 stop:2192 length:468 start_codon:yes stop_codon:yes gene_type:complete
MTQFIVLDPEMLIDNELGDPTGLFIVEAKNKEEALLKASKFLLSQDRELFEEYTYSTIANEGLCGKFLFVTSEEDKKWNEKAEVITSPETFKWRIRKYFGKQQKYADLYIEQQLEDKDLKFPEEMIQFLWDKKFTEWVRVTIKPMDEISLIGDTD